MKCENSATEGGPGASHSAISIQFLHCMQDGKIFASVWRGETFASRFSTFWLSGIAKHGLVLSEGKWTNPTLLELWHSALVAMATGSVSQSDLDNEVHPGRRDG